MEDENYNFQILFFPKPLINSVPNECINPPPPQKKNLPYKNSIIHECRKGKE